MARINFEDELESDFRFKRLVRLLGDEDKAFGMLYRFWKVAQKCWGDEMSLVVEADFKMEGFEPILQAGLAEVRSNGVYAKGSEERFAWYLQKCRASKAGVGARKKKTDEPNTNPGQPEFISGQPASCSGQPDLDSGQPEPEFRLTADEIPVNPLALAPVLALVPVPVLDKKENTIAPQAKKTVVYGAIQEFSENEAIVTALQAVKQDTQRLWLETYPDSDWINQELLKGLIWISENPQKAPQKFGRFMSNWLAKGWESHRKTLPSNPLANAPPARFDPRKDPEIQRIEQELAKWKV